MMKYLFNIILVILLISSCGKKEEKKDFAQQELELVKSSFNKLTGWKNDDVYLAKNAFLHSCERFKNSKTKYLGSAKIKIKTSDFLKKCQLAKNVTDKDFKNFIEQNFEPFLVKYNGSSQGKFTAYYEPKIKVSEKPDEKYKYPIHAKPLDLIEFNPNDFDETLPSRRLVGRIENNKLVPYYSREEIGQGKGNIPVLLWSDSFVDVFVMHIQGPAVAEFENGKQIRISYADTNGRKFSGIGSLLLKNNEIKSGDASMGKIKQWMINNPQKAVKYMEQNKRYVFHQIIGATGPLGAIGKPLSAGRSLAVDPQFVPLGALLWLDTTLPNGNPLRRLVNAQDVGGAIKGAIRGDYFWGSGGDDVLEQAGKMNSTGSYYVLLPISGE